MDEELDEQSLFDAAVSDEPAEVPIAEPAEVPEKPEDEPVREEAGRFAKADEPEKLAETDQAKTVDDNAAQVPSWRLRELNDEKRALADRLSALEAERSTWQRQQAAEKTAVEEKAAKPDPLLDPDGYEKYIENRIEEKLLNDRREFEEAYAAAQKQIDPALKARMQQSRDPGETLMEWHRELKTRAEIGGDLNAYKQKLRDEYLKDPEFRKSAMAAWREDAQSSSSGRPRVDLPPSLNGASRSNSMLRGDGDIPDPDLWNEITA